MLILLERIVTATLTFLPIVVDSMQFQCPRFTSLFVLRYKHIVRHNKPTSETTCFQQVVGLDSVDHKSLPRLHDESITSVYLEVFVFHGENKLPKTIRTIKPRILEHNPRWDAWLMDEFERQTLVSELPREARVGFLLWGKPHSSEAADVRLAWCVLQLVDHYGHTSMHLL